MLTATIAVAVTGFVITIWLLGIANHARPGTDQANARLDAVRTGLAAGAAAGAAVGLMLAFRRQHHQEISTVLTDHDATERRITELYTKAVEQLGDDKAPVRLGGLYALERLAQDNHAHRQTIVNVICAYLRMPFAAGASTGISGPAIPENVAELAAETKITRAAADEAWQQEKQVRLTAQRILSEHMRKPDGDDRQAASSYTRFWSQIRLDFTGATLINFSLADGMVADALFAGATFSGHTSFSGAVISGDAQFSGATFSDFAVFRDTTFNGEAMFDKATFNGEAWFGEATFNGTTGFHEVAFNDRAQFDGAAFSREAGFSKATFNGRAGFDTVTFSDAAYFHWTTFSFEAWFRGATFSDEAGFAESTFSREAGFTKATFNSIAYFGHATFSREAGFTKATFKGRASFHGAQFDSKARFDETAFGGEVSFAETISNGPEAFNFTDALVLSFDGDSIWPTGWQLSDKGKDSRTLVPLNGSNGS